MAIRETDAALSPAARGERDELAQRLTDCFRDLAIEAAPLAGGDLPDLSSSSTPDPAAIAPLLALHDADVLVVVDLKEGKSSLVVQLAVLNDSKTLLKLRITLRRPKPPASAPKGKGPAATTASYGGSGSAGILTGGGGTGAWPGSIAALASGGNFGSGQAPGVGAGAATDPADVSELNARILEFTLNSTGTQVGNGECWTLAAHAMKYAGAAPPDQYDFGDEVTLAELKPGDILHFYQALFLTPYFYVIMGAPDHVAVVGEVRGATLVIYHQNVGGNRTVRKDTLDVTTLVSGTITGYRARARESLPQ